jgi:hypothetical protein
MARTKITSKVLALSAAQTNINNDGSFTLSVPTQINNTLTTNSSVSVGGNLTVDTNTLFVDSVNDRVGIGTVSPTASLDIFSGNLFLRTGSVSVNTITNYNNSGLLTLNYQGGSFSVTNNTTTVIHATQAGNVGINTTTPTSKLHVVDDWGTMKTSNSIASGFSLFPNSGNTSAFTIFRQGNTTSRAFFIGINNANTEIGTTNGSISFNTNTLHLAAGAGGNVGIGTTTPNERLTVAGNVSVSGHISAATKSFKIPHQSKGGHLQYGVVESDCHSVLVRGKISSDTITLPDHWSWLVDADSVTVQLTPVGCYQQLYVISSDNQTVKVGGVTGEYCYVVYGTRKDVAPLEVEIE